MQQRGNKRERLRSCPSGCCKTSAPTSRLRAPCTPGRPPLCAAEPVLDPTIPPSVFGAEIARTEGKCVGRSWLGLLPGQSSEGWVCPEEEREAELGNNNRMCNNRMRRADLGPNATSLIHFSHGCHCGCSVTKLCPTLCNPMNYSMPGFPVLHYLLEFAQTHVH